MKTNPNDSAQPTHGSFNEFGDCIDDPRNKVLSGGLTKREIFAMTQMASLLSTGEKLAIQFAYIDGFNEAISQMQPEWVPCKHKDKMPTGKYILLLEKDGFQSECIFRVSEKEAEREIPYFYVTHLIRLPQPPKDINLLTNQ